MIDLGKDHELAAYFLIGREQLIPNMFSNIVDEILKKEGSLNLFKSYLERHIEVDGDK